MSKPSVADQMLIDWRREVLHENRRLRAAVDKVRALCDEAAAYAPDTSGTRVLSVADVRRALDEALADE